MKRANVLRVLVAVATIFIGITFTQCGSSDDKQVELLAKEVNRMMNCPVKVDFMTQLDSVYALPGREIHYHFTIFDHTISDIDELISREEINNNLRAMMLSIVNVDSKDAERFRQLKIIIVSEYYDKNGELYTVVRVGPQEYS